MKEYIFLSFIGGSVLYVLSAVLAIIRMNKTRNIIFIAGTLAIFISLLLRIYYNWPLMCLFQEPYIITLFAGIITIFLFLKSKELCLYSGAIAVILSLYVVFFSGDIYVSFRKTNSIFAHIFSFLSSFARASYLCAGAMALRGIILRKSENYMTADNVVIGNLIIAGYCLHSVGMFSGGLWSYAGWGMPVQWQSNIFLGMAGVWFFYSWYLHFKLSVSSSKPTLAYAALAGGVVTFIFSFLPDTGKFNIPGIFQ